MSFSLGPNSIPRFYVTEIFSQDAKPLASSISSCVTWSTNFIVSISFTHLTDLAGENVYIIFMILQIAFLVFVWRCVPETNQKTFSEISVYFS